MMIKLFLVVSSMKDTCVARYMLVVMQVFLLCFVIQDIHAFQPSDEKDSIQDFLSSWNLGRDQQKALDDSGEWNASKQSLVLKLMARLNRATSAQHAGWNSSAIDIAQTSAASVMNSLVKVEGRAVFVAPYRLPEDEAVLAGQDHLDVVRIVTSSGKTVDVILQSAPKDWLRWSGISQPVVVFGLPIGRKHGPVPTSDNAQWPAELRDMFLLGTRLSWYPQSTRLGRLGMDYALFDSVVDGRPFVQGDTDAFFEMLTVVSHAKNVENDFDPTMDTDVIPIIDPAEKWFDTNRGEMVTIEGTARRVTRIEIDDPDRQKQVGAKHYWEIYVFVPTSLIRVNNRLQDDYPIVCCVRTIPASMPTGDRITENIRLSGFAFKRYAYSLPRVHVASPQGDGNEGGARRETPLIIGDSIQWIPSTPSRDISEDLGWFIVGTIGGVGLLLAAVGLASWKTANRSRRKSQERLPDKIDILPGDGGG